MRQARDPAILTATEFAAAIGVCRRTLQKMLAAGKIKPAWRTAGGHGRFTLEQIETWRARPSQQAPIPSPPAPSPLETPANNCWIEAARWARRKIEWQQDAELRRERKRQSEAVGNLQPSQRPKAPAK